MMEMIKNKQKCISPVFPSNCPFTVCAYQFILLYIPRRKASAFILQNMYAIKLCGPVIKVFLIAKFSILHAAETPFDAAIFPPFQHAHSVRGIFERYKLHAINSAD